ncbi:MAG: hypothetical protein A4S14_05875 [Proteobacteria bacterium SG_bin9]|nr:MAG: hypothetical protein A4S14_05875 [Proteobacteria bacterium SG_bin9]
MVAPSELRPFSGNARIHSPHQIRKLARLIERVGFNTPILVDKNGMILSGHARLAAALQLELDKIPIISLEHLSEAEARAFILAENKMAELSRWDHKQLSLNLKELRDLSVEFDIEITGFETPEIDILLQSLMPDDSDAIDNHEYVPAPIVSRLGDRWQLGDHVILCGNAQTAESYSKLLGSERAAVIFADPPFNVPINGHASGKGSTKHREFLMASGEMPEPEFISFLETFLGHSGSHSIKTALFYICIDWRHAYELLAASRSTGLTTVNLCVWAKTNGGMGSFYRSQHELVFLFKPVGVSHTNNVQLGQFGRNRTNVWNYPGANVFPKGGRKRATELHPTVKPIGLVADAILDSTNRGDIVLDPFAGSGTTILAAERTGRRAYTMELDPAYVDLAVRRWQQMTGRDAVNDAGQTFKDVAIERGLS